MGESACASTSLLVSRPPCTPLHLHRTGHPLDAVPHFKRAHELDPTNWSYQRQARNLADPAWGPVYETDLFTEVGKVGPQTWRPALDM